MKHSILIGVIAVLFSTPLVGQGQDGNQPTDIQMTMPWRAWEFGFQAGWAGVPRAQTMAEPFKMFDNIYYVGLQTNSVLLITTSEGLMNLNDNVVYRGLRLGPLHQLHPGRSRSLVRHNDCLHRPPACV